jgi:shikimate kinase
LDRREGPEKNDDECGEKRSQEIACRTALELQPFQNTKSASIIHAAISIVNALATGKGGAIGVDIPCKVEAKVLSKEGSKSIHIPKDRVIIKSSFQDNHNLVKTCVRTLLRSCRIRLPEDSVISLSIKSSIPIAVGLKSSSAVSLATVEAVAGALGIGELGYEQKLRISCNASKESGASLTGAYDDASACLLGGAVLADNRKFKILKHSRVPDSLGKIVSITLPSGEKKYTSNVSLSAYSKFKAESETAFEYAARGEISQAMMLNSIIQCSALGYSFRPISSALSEGAAAAGISGKGPSIAALCATNKIANAVEMRWRDEASNTRPIRLIRTKIVQPARIVHS